MTHLPPEIRPNRERVPAATARGARSVRAAGLPQKIRRTIALALLCLVGSAGAADDASKQQMQSLDEQVQEIKSDVLGIAAELSQLEERLLYPSNTQVSIFVSLTEDDGFRLDSVEIEIDGELAAHHIYSFKELEALRSGGVQRIYTGNVPTGEHQISVTVGGKAGGNDVRSTDRFRFEKEVEPKLVEITLAGSSGGASIQLGGS